MLDAINAGVTIPRRAMGGIAGAVTGAAAVAGNVVVKIINNAPGVDVTEKPNSGGREFEVTFAKMFNDHVGSGKADNVLRRFGSKPLPQGG